MHTFFLVLLAALFEYTLNVIPKPSFLKRVEA